MSELPHRPNDHLVEPMFAALGAHEDRERPVHASRRGARALRVVVWLAFALCVLAAAWWLLLA
jgi:hypothetical protein